MKARDNRKYVERCRDHFLSTYSACVRERWTSDKYTSQRNIDVPAPPHTRNNAGEIWGYQRAMWDALWVHVEWRLGFADIATAVSPFPFGPEREALGIGLPTHGGFFWKGTNDIFTEWKAL